MTIKNSLRTRHVLQYFVNNENSYLQVRLVIPVSSSHPIKSEADGKKCNRDEDSNWTNETPPQRVWKTVHGHVVVSPASDGFRNLCFLLGTSPKRCTLP